MEKQYKNILLEEANIIEVIKKNKECIKEKRKTEIKILNEKHKEHNVVSFIKCEDCKKNNEMGESLDKVLNNTINKFKNILFKKSIIVQGLYYKTEKEYYLDSLLNIKELLEDDKINFNKYVIEDVLNYDLQK